MRRVTHVLITAFLLVLIIGVLTPAPSVATGQAQQVNETYWTWCSGSWWPPYPPYPCQKTRQTIKYYYDRLYTHRTGYGLYCTYEACESDGVLHKWSSRCLAVGSLTCYYTGYKSSQLPNSGSCKYVNNPSIERCP
jgi:hypothetical protein